PARGTPVGSEARNRDCGKVGGANGSLGQFGHRRGAEFFVCARLGPARATAFAREASRSKSVTNAAIAGVYGRVGSCLCQGLPSRAGAKIATEVSMHGIARVASAAVLFASALATLAIPRSEEHTSELQSRGHLVCRVLPEKKNINNYDK